MGPNESGSLTLLSSDRQLEQAAVISSRFDGESKRKDEGKKKTGNKESKIFDLR